MRRLSTVELMLSVTVLIWALNFTVTRYALTHGWQPLAYSGLRYAAGALLFAALTFALERSFAVRGGRDILLLAIGAVAGIWLNQVAYVYAIKLTNATTVALVLGVTPIFAALGAFIAGLERMSRRFVLAAAVSFAGVVLVALGAGGALDLDPLGVVLAVATAATWAMYSIAITPLMRRYSPYRISALVLLAGCVPLVAVALPQIVSQDYGEPTGRAWLAFGFAIVGPLVLTNVLWFRSVARVGPSRATLFANIQPFIAAVIAVVVLSERMSATQLAGGMAIAAGMLLARRRQRVQPLPE